MQDAVSTQLEAMKQLIQIQKEEDEKDKKISFFKGT